MAQQRPYPITPDERRLATHVSRSGYRRSMAAKGHEDAFRRPTLSARCRFSQGTFAGMRGNGRDAPEADSPLGEKHLLAAKAISRYGLRTFLRSDGLSPDQFRWT